MTVGAPRDPRCTLEDVAARAGVSRATVSRVVNGSTHVSDGVRRAVEAAIDEMGYAPNRAARSLAGNRSETVALVVSEPSVRLFADPFFAGTTIGVAGVLDGTAYQIVLVMSGDDDAHSAHPEHLLHAVLPGEDVPYRNDVRCLLLRHGAFRFNEERYLAHAPPRARGGARTKTLHPPPIGVADVSPWHGPAGRAVMCPTPVALQVSAKPGEPRSR